jgi:hypothetical protein
MKVRSAPAMVERRKRPRRVVSLERVWITLVRDLRASGPRMGNFLEPVKDRCATWPPVERGVVLMDVEKCRWKG